MTSQSHSNTIRVDESTIRAPAAISMLNLLGWVGCIALLVAVVWGYQHGWSSFFRSYILNYAFAMSLAQGGLFFVMVQHLTRAAWSVAVRRVAELVAGLLPLLCLFGLPILIPVWSGDAQVYPWANASEVALDPIVQAKAAYLNPTFFTLRLLAYFGIWVVLVRVFVGSSLAQDRSGSHELTERMRRLSPVGVLLYAFTTTFFAIDLLMSLTPHWYSTIYGVYYFAGSTVGFFALLAIMLFFMQLGGLLRGSVTAEHLHDIGKYMLGFTIFWTYIAFSQYMLIWYADLPEETEFYFVRQQTSWWIGVTLALLIGHFAVPFFALLPRGAKRNSVWLASVATLVMAMHWLDIYYLVGPLYHHLQASWGRAFVARQLGCNQSQLADRLYRFIGVPNRSIDEQASAVAAA